MLWFRKKSSCKNCHHSLEYESLKVKHYLCYNKRRKIIEYMDYTPCPPEMSCRYWEEKHSLDDE
jgi:hypothetical protein